TPAVMYPSLDLPGVSRGGYTVVDGASEARRTRMAIEIAQTRRRFTRKEYHRMVEVGILRPKDRVELIRGEIVEMSPIGPRHKGGLDNLNMLLVPLLVGRAIVRVQGSILLGDDTEPEPDLVVLRLRAAPYREVDATAEDVLLLI